MTDQQLKILAKLVLTQNAVLSKLAGQTMRLIDDLLPHLPSEYGTSYLLSEREQLAALARDAEVAARLAWDEFGLDS